MPRTREPAQANLENLYRIFTVPEAPDSTLGRIDQAISDNLAGFLQDHIVAVERDLVEIEADFSQSRIPEDPMYVSHYTDFLKEKLVSQSVHTASPGFIGHMTSALPYFMLPLSRILTALNQNLVKVETSRAFTPMERQVLGMLHRLIYSRDDAFYGEWIQDSRHALGAFCSGGTVANLTALWAARNRLCGPAQGFGGIAQEGLLKAMQHLDCKGLAILVSRRGHYSLGKAADVLGIGRDNLVAVDTDDRNRIDMKSLRQQCATAPRRRHSPLEPGGRCRHHGNRQHRPARRACRPGAGTRLPLPRGCRLGRRDLALRQPQGAAQGHRAGGLGHHRRAQADVRAHGRRHGAVQGSHRPGRHRTPRRLHPARRLARPGQPHPRRFATGHGHAGTCRPFHHRPQGLRDPHRPGHRARPPLRAGHRGPSRFRTGHRTRTQHPHLPLQPGLDTDELAAAPAEKAARINEVLDKVTETMQKRQRENGRSFVSRTRLAPGRYRGDRITVFRVVLANPLTTDTILSSVLEEQCEMAGTDEILVLLEQIRQLCGRRDSPIV
jgi:glutamate decarboxylase